MASLTLRDSRHITNILPWILSLLVVGGLTITILMLKGQSPESAETLDIRSIDIAVPPPPEPPPPIRTQTPQESPTPSINLMGQGTGPQLSYSDNPKLTLDNLQKIPKPEFDPKGMDLSSTLSVDFPLIEVKELDAIPRLVSNHRVSFPHVLRDKGVSRVATKVEIIIDQSGKAFVKKIVDPVYPEMVDVIRKAINDSRFTIPTKDGRPVQAIYLYTLVFINRN
jgi:protein TonB